MYTSLKGNARMSRIIEINNCLDCPHVEHNGLLQSNPKRVCAKTKGRPILGAITKKNIVPPEWCPLEEKEN